MSNTYPPALGIDFGRVIISSVKDDGRADTAFLQGSTKEAMQTPPNERAFEVIKELVEAFEGRVWIVSKAGKRIQQRTRQWLHTHKFYEQTGIPKEHLRFCIKGTKKPSIVKSWGSRTSSMIAYRCSPISKTAYPIFTCMDHKRAVYTRAGSHMYTTGMTSKPRSSEQRTNVRPTTQLCSLPSLRNWSTIVDV